MIKHYLITVATFSRTYIHAYLMTENRKYVDGVADKMLDLAEEQGLQPMGMILLTELANEVDGPPDPESIKLVRGTISKLNKEAEEHFRAAQNYHLSIFSLTENHPDNDPLMKLH